MAGTQHAAILILLGSSRLGRQRFRVFLTAFHLIERIINFLLKRSLSVVSHVSK